MLKVLTDGLPKKVLPKGRRVILWAGFTTILLLLLTACQNEEQGQEQNGKEGGEVVVYTSVDQMFSEPVLQQFEEETGITVHDVYDVEATKTTGLVNRLIAEKDHPQADVFWNGEFAQTVVLKNEGLLTPYLSPEASDIPDYYIDPDQTWMGFGGRARILIINQELLEPEDYPQSIFELTTSHVPADKIGIAYPLFGTTATHAASIYAALSPEGGYRFFQELQETGLRVVDGNSVVKDMVASGELVMGLTDTDDAFLAIDKGDPVEIVFLDQEEDGFGTLVIPNSVAKIKNGPNPQEAQQLIDYLVSRETEKELLDIGWIDLTVRPLEEGEGRLGDMEIREMEVGFDEIFNHLERAKEELTEIFVR